jgi:hypothetical protein
VPLLLFLSFSFFLPSLSFSFSGEGYQFSDPSRLQTRGVFRHYHEQKRLPDELVFPASQAVQLDKATPLPYVPAAQFVHVVAAACEYVPGPHASPTVI